MSPKDNHNPINSLVAKLHPLERIVLPVLTTEQDLSGIIKRSQLQEIEAMRALQWLEHKGALKIIAVKKKIISLDANGIAYRKSGLPEKLFLQALDGQFKGLNVITKKSKLSREEVNACIGLLKKKQAIETEKGEILQVKITDEGKKLLVGQSKEEQFLQKHFPLDEESLSPEDKAVVAELLRRKDVVKVEEKKDISIELTSLGKELASADLEGVVINRLTAKMLKDGSWKDQLFRSYDVEAAVPKRFFGKKHFVTQASEYAKKVWMDMGFVEMTGNMVQTSFWNFDALFTAQDHPVREMQDTFFLGGKAEKGMLPSSDLVKKVKQVHENGGDTGSTGWMYKWDEEEAKKNVLRTHTTVLTAQNLAKLKEIDLPVKLFAFGKNFRNEALDWNHLSEFNQTEGIVVDKNVNFCHLLGYLKQFFTKMGFPQARFRPAFFPYTSPSVEIDVYHPVHHKWVEFGGAGMMRPEVVVPLLGKDIPVLAWGPGFDRIILDYWGIADIRDLYRNDVKQLREQKMWLR